MSENDQNLGTRELRIQIADLKGKIRKMQFEEWRKLLGLLLDEAILSLARTRQLLSSADPAIRKGALCLLTGYWPPCHELDSIYRELALCDPDFDVRAASVGCVLRLYKNTYDRDVSRFMASIAVNAANPYNLRGMAYVALLDIQGVTPSFELFRDLEGCSQSQSLPESLDWSMVRSFL